MSGRLGESSTERIALGDKDWAGDSGDDFYSGCRNDSKFPENDPFKDFSYLNDQNRRLNVPFGFR